jgi:hypothetical protein
LEDGKFKIQMKIRIWRLTKGEEKWGDKEGKEGEVERWGEE